MIHDLPDVFEKGRAHSQRVCSGVCGRVCGRMVPVSISAGPFDAVGSQPCGQRYLWPQDVGSCQPSGHLETARAPGGHVTLAD